MPKILSETSLLASCSLIFLHIKWQYEECIKSFNLVNEYIPMCADENHDKLERLYLNQLRVILISFYH